jgi:peroxiredoxin family protein
MAATAEAVRDEPVIQEHTPHKKLVIMAWSGDLDRIWPTLILGTTGAAMGMETTIFFTFWGLFPLVRDDVRITGDSWMQKLLATMDRPGLEHVKLGKMNFAGAGPAMIRKLARTHHVASPEELVSLAKDLGVKLVPCQMTMDLLGLHEDDLIEGLEPPAGATTALVEAQDAITLFI